MRYFLKLSFDGTNYHGWQRQPNALSVQQTLEDSLSIILRKETEVTGAGRTDAGVHAGMMYAHFDTLQPLEEVRFLSSLNKLVGKEISVHSLLPVKDDAHARFDAVRRTYQYFIYIGKDPFSYRFSHQTERMPDYMIMNEAASLLLETKDFTSFAKLHSDVRTNFCNVTEANWKWNDISNQLVFTISADRFLRNMVRSIVGTLIEVGYKKITVEEFKEIIEKKDRCSAGTSMAAKGLFLTNISYPPEIFI